MSAHRELRLLHRRGGLVPGRWAPADRVDQVEVVEIASGETVRLWDVPAREVAAMLADLRADLRRLAPEEFLGRWRDR